MALAILVLGAALPSGAQAAEALNLFPDFSIVALNLALFSALIWPTNRYVLQPLLRVIEARGQATQGTLVRADALHAEAQQVSVSLEERLAAARSQATARRAEVIGRADAQEREILEAARAAAATTVDEVREGIAAELDDARGALEPEARELAREAATAILGRSL